MHFWLQRFARPKHKAKVDADFAAALEGQDSRPLPLVEAMEEVRAKLPEANNFGQTGDERDLYTLIDRVAQGVTSGMPQSLCHKGCDACCHYPVGLFVISYSEWRLIVRHMETVWDEAERAEFVLRYRAVFTPFWRAVVGFLQDSWFTMLLTAPILLRQRIACPFLKNGQCSVYAARPYQCRTFGAFTARTWPFKEPRVYACNAQGQLLHQAQTEGVFGVQLPVMNLFVKRIRAMCRGPRLSLPMWALMWVRRYERRQAQRDASRDNDAASSTR